MVHPLTAAVTGVVEVTEEATGTRRDPAANLRGGRSSISVGLLEPHLDESAGPG